MLIAKDSYTINFVGKTRFSGLILQMIMKVYAKYIQDDRDTADGSGLDEMLKKVNSSQKEWEVS